MNCFLALRKSKGVCIYKKICSFASKVGTKMCVVPQKVGTKMCDHELI